MLRSRRSAPRPRVKEHNEAALRGDLGRRAPARPERLLRVYLCSTITDTVLWRRRAAVSVEDVEAARVAAGPWRWFVLELKDGTARTLVGAGPLQFPACRFDRGGATDLAALDVLMGDA